jgi:hypothetical protein
VEDVEPAPGPDRLIHHRAAIGGARDVGGECFCRSAFFFDFSQGLLRTGKLCVHAQHACAFAREKDCRGLAVAQTRAAGTRARDDCDLAF